jgi:CubicO group peptidase (beta-lactamase class C family)
MFDEFEGLGTYGVHLYAEGKESQERRFRSDDRVNLYSVSKTFTSVALGMAEAEGRLSLDDRLLDLMPELRPIAADGFEAVTLRHLLTMTSGTSHLWFADQRIDAADLLHEIVAAPLEAEPGSRFQYTGSGPYAISRVIAKLTGADLRAYLLPRLFAPLDLHNPAWHACPLGYSFAESDLFLRTHELARFARLLVQDGMWEGRPVIPAGYVARMTSESFDLGEGKGYGLGVWLEPSGRYSALGRHGQLIAIDPAKKAAVTVTAHHEGDVGDIIAAINALLDAV